MVGFPAIGERIGAYRVDAEIGRGGMGIVYRATQLTLNRPVALKILDPRLAADPSFVERFSAAYDLELQRWVDAGRRGEMLYGSIRDVPPAELQNDPPTTYPLSYVLAPLIVIASFNVASVILSEASLSLSSRRPSRSAKYQST